MADIDIGAACIDRNANFPSGFTGLGKDNPANASGTIGKVFVWAEGQLLNAVVAIFYQTNGDIFTARDSEAIGTVPAGSAQEFAVNLDVEVGDFIGIYYTAGAIERSTVTFLGIWYKSGDQTGCTDAEFLPVPGDAISLYGESEEAPPPAKKTLVQAALISIAPLVVLPTLREILKFTGGRI